MNLTPATRLARPRWRPGVAAWALWALTMLGILVIAWLDQVSRQAGRPELAQLTLGAFVGPVQDPRYMIPVKDKATALSLFATKGDASEYRRVLAAPVQCCWSRSLVVRCERSSFVPLAAQ